MLSHRWIINCSLIALIAVLTYIGLQHEESAVATQSTRVSELAAEDIDRIEIQSGDMQLRLSRLGDDWTIQQPISWPAHTGNVRRLLSIVNSNAEVLANAADVDLGALGLQQPIASMRFNDLELRFGASNNIGERRYLMIDSRIYLLPDIHLAFIAQGLPGIVDRQLLPKRFRVASIQLPELEIERVADGQWRTLPPAGYAQAQLQQLVDNWQQLQASRIHPFDLGGSARQLIEVRLKDELSPDEQSADGQSIDFLLMSTARELIIANPQIGLQYHFLKSYEEQMIAIPDASQANQADD